MRCRIARKLSSDYLAGELDDRQRSAIRGHLRQCSRCQGLYHDEAALVRAAESAEPLDPPASLWEGIAARLADAEVEDARRSRVWFWWRGVWHRHRAHVAGAALAAVTALVLWAWPALEGDPEPGAVSAAVKSAGASGGADHALAADTELDFALARGQELARADARYRGTAEELRALIAESAENWPARRRQQHAARLRDFESRLASHRQAGLGGMPRVFDRDALYGVYREEIEYLTRVAFEEGL